MAKETRPNFLVFLTDEQRCVGNAGCKDDSKDKRDASVPFEETLSKAKAGDVAAMFNLSVAYDNGEGVIKDDEEAVKWWRKAAVLGDATAMCKLGLMYATGEGVIEDDVEAYAWFNVAAKNGQKTAAKLCNNIKKTMTPEQITEGQKRSREIMESLP